MKNWLKIKHEGFFTSKIQVSKYMDWKNGETVDRIKHSWFALKKKLSYKTSKEYYKINIKKCSVWKKNRLAYFMGLSA